MLVYVKNRSDFAPVLKVNSEKYELPLATVGTESGSITIPEELDESLSGNWVYILGHVVLITQVSPKDGETKIATADPSAAFDRQCPWPDNPAATYGGFIAAALQADYKACADEAYALAYLSISNTDATPLTAPELDDTKLYKLSDIIAQARRSGVRIDFTVATTTKASDTLSVEISTAVQSDSYIVFSDGKSQLSSETFSSDSTAKVTVMQEVEQADSAAEPVYISTDYYLSASGDVSTSVPASRAAGKWAHTTCKSDEDPAATAAAIFAQNINSHKIEFYSTRAFDLLSPVTMRLNKTVYSSRIIYIGKSSKDSRTLYKCGELATTLTDKIRASGGTAVYKTTVAGGGVTYPITIDKGGTGATTAEAALAALGGVSIVKLWENASPGSAFAAQTVALDLSGYTAVRILYSAQIYTGSEITACASAEAPIGRALALMCAFNTNVANYYLCVETRLATISTSGVTFSDCYESRMNSAAQVAVGRCIPLSIYGVKGVT